MNKKNIEKEAPKYTSRLIVRLTPQLHKEIAEYAALCGLTTSAYARKRLEGKYPKQRLTDKEMEAHLTTRADDIHAPPVSTFPEGHLIYLYFVSWMSSAGKVLRVASN